MTLTGYGFDGTVTETAWAQMADDLGSDYTVSGPVDFQPTIVSGGATRTVSVDVGSAYGRGVRVVNSAPITVQHATVATGSRWDLVALRRDWSGAGGTATVVPIVGTSAQAIPAGRLTAYGTGQDDQPLALVQITAGQTIPTALIDLRTWAGKVYQANSLLALPDAQQGYVASINGVRYDRVVSPPSTILTWARRSECKAFNVLTVGAVNGGPYGIVSGTPFGGPVALGNPFGQGIPYVALVDCAVMFYNSNNVQLEMQLTVNGLVIDKQAAAFYGNSNQTIRVSNQAISLVGADLSVGVGWPSPAGGPSNGVVSWYPSAIAVTCLQL